MTQTATINPELQYTTDAFPSYTEGYVTSREFDIDFDIQPFFRGESLWVYALPGLGYRPLRAVFLMMIGGKAGIAVSISDGWQPQVVEVKCISARFEERRRS